MQKRAPPRLSKEAQEWDKLFPSPTKEKCGKKTTTPYVIPRCSECDGVLIEDRASGDLICQECGLCERLLIPDDVEYMDVDWTRISLTTKSQHVPAKYMLDLIRRFGIDERLVPELTVRYKAVKYWSERNKPAWRKSLPNYPYTLHRLLLQLGKPEEAAKVKLPSGKKVRLRLEEWWDKIEPFVFFRDGIDLSPDRNNTGPSLPMVPEEPEEVCEPPRWELPGGFGEQQEAVFDFGDQRDSSYDTYWCEED
ncbi:hypothetical protein WJX79_001581 [Trebouxia sp. C0005]